MKKFKILEQINKLGNSSSPKNSTATTFDMVYSIKRLYYN